MVDLVKIRKKAKESKEKETAASNGAPPPSAAPLGGGTKSPAEDTGASLEPPVDKIARFLATAGERHIDVTGTTDVQEELQELLTFKIAGELYAVDIEHVVEIITPRPITRVPNADRSVVGILSLRGAVVTIIDVRLRLGHPPLAAVDADTRVVVAEDRGENLGFTVDRVQRVVKVAPSSIEPHPVAHASEHDDSVLGVFRQGEALTILLDLENLLTTNGTDL
jgi:purine-binding chemotaxis protein CheW